MAILLLFATTACGTLGGAAIGAGSGTIIAAGTGHSAASGALLGAGIGAAAGTIYDATWSYYYPPGWRKEPARKKFVILPLAIMRMATASVAHGQCLAWWLGWRLAGARPKYQNAGAPAQTLCR